MKYELNKIYTACAKTPTGTYRIYFTFSESHIESVMHCVSIRTNPRYHYEHIHYAPNATVRYSSPDGRWIMTALKEQYPTWVFKRNGHTYEPEVLEIGMKGRHYHSLTMDDMSDAFGYCTTKKEDVKKEVKQVLDWWNTVKTGEKKMSHDMIKKMFDACTSEKGGNKMTRYLYHVILFNTKTENIDFKEYVVAKDETDASMQAAQKYGKYSSVSHITIVRCIEGSAYEAKE